jgi:polyhydroxybutyrate depolymerase
MQKIIIILVLVLPLIGCQDSPRPPRNYPPPADFQARAERMGGYGGPESRYERRRERRAIARAQEAAALGERDFAPSWNDATAAAPNRYPKTMADPGDARIFPRRGQAAEFSPDDQPDDFPRRGGRRAIARADDIPAFPQRGQAAEFSPDDQPDDLPRRGGRRAIARADADWAFGQQGRGFGRSSFDATDLPPGFKTETLTVGGRARSYLLYAPDNLQKSRPVPLVMVFHGGGGNAQGIARTTNMHQLAARYGFIAVYPNGTGAEGNRRLSWNAGSTPPQGYAENQNVDDIGFVKAILRQLQQSYPIDSKRVYATGLSKGGMFAYRLACDLSDQIAAIAPVAGSLTYAQCRPARPVAVLHIHGGNDQNVPLEGGRGVASAQMANYPSALQGLDQWRRRNECATATAQTTVTADTNRFSYEGCKSGGEVTYYIVRGGGHGWPGSTPKPRQQQRGIYISNQLKASEEIWKFFAAHPKP